MTDVLSKTYDPKEVEEKLYSTWESAGYFTVSAENPSQPFTIVIPPPNVTGVLHMGHALDNTLQDILIRYKRMNGFATLWLPGTDHAGIATQNVVEKQLAKEGLNRKDLGREKFLERVWQWKETSGGQIVNQLRRLGASCDWSRERFTMDPGLSKAVRHVFVKLYQEKLIYRSSYLVSWCPRCQTALSDLEVEHEEVNGTITYFKYPVDGGSFITVATTRPETMLGDTAVAVHPDDERYKKLIGKTITHPFTKEIFSIIGDDTVDPKFGSGAVKITPAHDPNDYEMGKRHQLPMPTILDENGKIFLAGSPYHGLDRFVARKRIIEDLKTANLWEKTDPHKHAVGHCQRCNTVVEPRISDQWFVKIKELADPAAAAVREGKTKFVPENWTNTYLKWMDNIRDWCISRQLWWGHRIPVWYCDDCKYQTVMMQDPSVCEKCQSKNIHQDPDVLDTWFSSSLWAFSTLGWPEQTQELKKFYPTSVLVTGFDIIFFWVARMMMMGLKFMGNVPFQVVHIHALVRDEHGKKMSKSKGNVIDPLEVMDQYGTDAFRFALASFAIQGRDIPLSVKRIEGYRNFINKLWNAGRFLLQTYETSPITTTEKTLADRWIESRLATVTTQVRISIEEMRFNEAADTLYHFVWGEFCDWYLEMQKVTPNFACALSVYETILKLLHPMCPFVTEELWKKLPVQHGTASLMISTYPKDEYRSDPEAERTFQQIKHVVEAVRNFRSENKIAPSKQIKARLLVKAGAKAESKENELAVHASYIKTLAALSALMPSTDRSDFGKASRVNFGMDGVELEISWEGLVDSAAEKDRLEKLLEQSKIDAQFLKDRLSKPNYKDKAPRHLVEKDEEKLRQAELLIEKYTLELQHL